MSIPAWQKLQPEIEKRYSAWVYVFMVTAFAFLQFLFAMYHYPLLGDDSIAFLPASINVQQGNGLVNNTYWITRYLNIGQPEAAYVNYPPIFPLVNGYLLFFTDNLHLNAAIIHTITIGIFSLLAVRLNRNIFKIEEKKFFLLLFLFVAAWNTQLNPGEGRPEPLSQLWMIILLYNLLFNTTSSKSVFAAFLIGLVGFSHPVAGIYSLFICILYLLYNGINFKEIIRYVFGGILSLGLVALIYPFPLTRMLQGISEHGKLVADRSLHSASSFLYYHFTSPYVSFYFLIFLLACVGIFLFIHHRYSTIKNKLLFFTTFFTFLLIVFYFSFQTMEASYNLYVLLPFMAICSYYAVSHIRHKTFFFLSCIIMVFGSVGFVRRALLFNAHVKYGVSYNSAKRMLDKHMLAGNKIFVTASFYNLPSKISDVTDDIKDDSIQYILYQQNFTGLEKPPVFNGFRLIENTFSNRIIKVAGIKIASGPPGYQFALYKKEGDTN